MVRERLETLRRRAWDARIVALVGANGEPVESLATDDAADTDNLARTLAAQWRAAASEPDPLDGGYLRLLVVETDRCRILLGAVSESRCLMLAVGASGNDGQARFELRRAIQDLQRKAARPAL